jgi:hypothetical protein
MHVSFAEFMRVAPDVLRMLGGYPYLQADDAVEGLLVTHAALSRGYTVVRAADALGSNASSRPAVAPDALGDRVVLKGIPLALYAARVADLAIARAEPKPRRVLVEGVTGAWLAPYIASRIAAGGLAALLRWRPDDETSDEPPAALIAAPPGSTSLWIASSRNWAPPGEVAPAMGKKVALDPDFATLLDIPRGSLAVAAWPAAPADAIAALASGGYAALEGEGGRLEKIDVAARMARWIERGHEASDDDHAAWSMIARRLRLPTSERSRNQAG